MEGTTPCCLQWWDLLGSTDIIQTIQFVRLIKKVILANNQINRTSVIAWWYLVNFQSHVWCSFFSRQPWFYHMAIDTWSTWYFAWVVFLARSIKWMVRITSVSPEWVPTMWTARCYAQSLILLTFFFFFFKWFIHSSFYQKYFIF